MVTSVRCLAMGLPLPRATERLTWETEVTLRVGEEIFALGSPDSGPVCVEATKEDQAELPAAGPEVYSATPYAGRHGWALVGLAGVDPDELRDLPTTRGTASFRTSRRRSTARRPAGDDTPKTATM